MSPSDDGRAQSEPSAITVTVLVDNLAAQGLQSEHGFSVWIEVDGRRVLFDTGQGLALEGNAAKLGVDLRAVDVLVLSHGHYDHTGGVPLVVARAPAAEIYAHPAATGPRFSLRGEDAKPIGMAASTRAALDVHPVGVRWTAQPRQLSFGLGLTGPIPRLTEYEDTGGPFFIDAAGSDPDPLEDDLALWLRTSQGLVVVVGCSHAGLVNTLHQALKVSGESQLHAVLGGFHLKEASAPRLVQTVAALQKLAPDLVVPCHCTGSAAVERLEQTFGERVVQGGAGAVFRFGDVAGKRGHR
jgi:7,8-dihydropterin-6-yl-methyl-4-(beta-D-ribofuranosyl)aminobenzene 5'-phosphate synthase